MNKKNLRNYGTIIELKMLHNHNLTLEVRSVFPRVFRKAPVCLVWPKW